MNKAELEIKVEECFKHSEVILNTSGELIPMLDIEFIDSKMEKSIIAVGLVLGDDRRKRDMFIKGLGLTMGMFQRLGKIKEVRCVVMMSEAWFSSPSDKDYNLGNYLRPSQDPNRREMLLADGMTSDGINFMRSKEMFSVEVKGKKHFSLKDFPTDKGTAKSFVLENFFLGYKLGSEDSEKNKLLDKFAGNFESMSLDEMLQRSIKVLTQQVGGIESEFINYKK